MRVKIQFITLASALKTGCLFNSIVALLLSIPFFICALSQLFVSPTMLNPIYYPLAQGLMQLGCVSWFLGFCAYILLGTFIWGTVTIVYNIAAALTGGFTVKLARLQQPQPVPAAAEPVSKYEEESVEPSQKPKRSEPIRNAQTLTGVGVEVEQRQPDRARQRDEREHLKRVRSKWRGSV